MTTATIDWQRHPELLALVKKQWLDGNSASRIADEIANVTGMSISRNMIMGAVHRYGMARPVIHNRIAKLPVACKKPPKDSKRLLDLAFDECRWPLGEAGLFCAESCIPSSSYCQKHYDMARLQRQVDTGPRA